jgi:hypothetical protein
VVYVPTYQSLGSNLKTIRAARMLGIDKPTMVGHLLFLWWWAMDHAVSGDLSNLRDEEIEEIALWTREPGRFVHALIEARGPSGHGFLERADGVTRIHDWDDFAGAYVLAKDRHAAKMRSLRAKQREEQSKTRAVHVTENRAARAGNNRTGPDRTGPDRRGPESSSAVQTAVEMPAVNGHHAQQGKVDDDAPIRIDGIGDGAADETDADWLAALRRTRKSSPINAEDARIWTQDFAELRNLGVRISQVPDLLRRAGLGKADKVSPAYILECAIDEIGKEVAGGDVVSGR